MMGSQQEAWLDHAMRASVKRGARWQVVGVGTVMGKTVMPEAASGWLAPNAPQRARDYALNGIAAAKTGLPFNYDNWGGYPAARSRLLRSAQATGADLVVISGDSHNAWAYNLAEGGRPAGVEFGGTSVTSPGFETAIAINPRTAANEMVRANPEMTWCDLNQRGYMALTFTPEAVSNEWLMTPGTKTRCAAAGASWSELSRNCRTRVRAVGLWQVPL